MKKYLLAITASAMMFAACSNEENVLDENDNNPETNFVAVNFSAGITTRAIGNTWQKDDLIGISATGTDNVAYTNIQYKVAEDGASATFNAVNSEQAICFQNSGAMAFSAYYPYADVSATDGKIAKNTAQTQNGVDFLWGKVDNVNYSENPIVNFTFIHKMSQINVKVTPAAGVDINGQDIIIGGLKHDGTFNTTNGQATANTDATPENWTIGTPANNNVFTYTGLVYPQNANSLILTVGDKTATLKLNGDKFDPGHKYTITATVENNRINAKITIEGNTIQDWEDGSIANIAFIGDTQTADELNEEAKAAYNWLETNRQYRVTYLSVSGDNADLDQYKMIWAHLNTIPGNDITGTDDAIKSYYASGGAIIASREAMNKLIHWGIIPDGQGINVFIRDNVNENLGYAPGINIIASAHPIFTGFDNAHINLRPSNFYSEKKMLTWKFDDADKLNNWASATNGTILARDGENSVTMSEFTNSQSGHAITIGDPAFEWNKAAADKDNINNLYKLTTNAIDYLIGQSAK